MKKRGALLSVKTKLQNELVWMVIAAMAIPTFVFGGAMYYMIAKLTAPGPGLSLEEVVLDLTPYIAVLFPALVTLLLSWVFSATDKLVGPVDRMIQELDKRIQGQQTGPIVLRPGDRLMPLADKINVLLQGQESSKQP